MDIKTRCDVKVVLLRSYRMGSALTLCSPDTSTTVAGHHKKTVVLEFNMALRSCSKISMSFVMRLDCQTCIISSSMHQSAPHYQKSVKPPSPVTMPTLEILDLNTLPARDPMTCFRQWFDETQQCDGIRLPTSTSLATATKDGRPSVRVVGIKGFDDDGFKIATNSKSRKAIEMDENPFGSLMFYWEPLNRMVRIDGPVVKLSVESADNIWKGFPRAAQLTHGASSQDEPVTSRNVVLTKRQNLMQKYPDIATIPRNPDWCAYNLVPEMWEFYQASDELPDRLIFRRAKPGETADGTKVHSGLGGWLIERWSP